MEFNIKLEWDDIDSITTACLLDVKEMLETNMEPEYVPHWEACNILLGYFLPPSKILEIPEPPAEWINIVYEETRV